MARGDLEAAAADALDPDERLLAVHRVNLIRGRRFPPPLPPPDPLGAPDHAAAGSHDTGPPKAVIVGLAVLAIPFVLDRLPTVHGRTGDGPPGSMALACARVFERYAYVYLAVTDRRLLLLEQVPATTTAWNPPVNLAVSFQVPRGQVAASRRRWWLNGARLRLDFYDRSWLVLQVESFFPTKHTVGRIVAAATS